MDNEIDNILSYIKAACKEISQIYKEFNNIELSSKTNNNNKSGDDVKQLDIISNNIIKKYLNASGNIRASVSEEDTNITIHNTNSKYFVSFDPLDGSQNIDVNFSTGSIFGIFKYNKNNLIESGKDLVAACYCIYGPSTQLIIGYNNNVSLYSLQREDYYPVGPGKFKLVNNNIKIPDKTKIYSINEGNYNKWTNNTIRKFVDKMKGRSIRWSACMAADVHRFIMCGGSFIYPNDIKYKTGRLRLLYEIFPLSFIVKLAGGYCINEKKEDILSLKFPLNLHKREPILMFSNADFRIFNSI